MARNGSGTYTKVNTFTAGAPITAASHNQNWDDVAAEITNSVAADGQTSMTGPLKASSGTAAAPSISFGSDADSGWYRVASNNIGGAVGGVKIIDVSASGLGVMGAVDATGYTQNGVQLIPAGLVLPYAGSSEPTGYLFCYGQAISRTTYAALFAVIGTTYGAGDATTTFNLPDIRGRVIAGQDDMGGASANRLTGVAGSVDGDVLGGSGGEETHTITEAELAAHLHAQTAQTPTFTFSTAGFGDGSPSVPQQVVVGISPSSSGNSLTTVADATPGNTASVGGGSPHNNVQPTLILNYIIKT